MLFNDKCYYINFYTKVFIFFVLCKSWHDRLNALVFPEAV